MANDDMSASAATGESYDRVRRSGLSMLRLGRGLQMLRLGKRALPMLRLGRSNPNGITDEDIQYLLSIVRQDRQVPLPRYGKDISKDLAFQYMLMNALKNVEDNSNEYFDNEGSDSVSYAFPYESTSERQIRPAPRPGYRYRRSADGASTATNSNDDKDILSSDDSYKLDGLTDDKDKYSRVAPLMRYGKLAVDMPEYDEEIEKRNAMRMLRLGRGMRMLRLGKRPSYSDSEEFSEADKRGALRLLRLGKRSGFRMLRLGRGTTDAEAENRAEENES